MERFKSILHFFKSRKFFTCVVVSFLIHLFAVFHFSVEKSNSSFVVVNNKKMKVTKILFRPKDHRQVVDSVDSIDKTKPIDSKFGGKQDQTFKKQTVAKKIGAHKNAGKGVLQASLVNKNQFQKTKKLSNYKRFKRKKTDKIAVKDLVFDNFSRKKLDALAHSSQQKHGVINGEEKETGSAVRSDYIEDIPLGDLTQLNTSEYRFHSYLTRFKKQMEGHWRLSVRKYAEKGSFGRMPASTGLKTGLMIILDGKGDVVRIAVKQSCGISELDQIAVNAIYKAGSFPNPPKDMVVGNRVEIPFGFVVE